VNDGVGDMSKIILENNVGVVIKNFDRKEIVKSFRMLKALSTEEDITQRCRATAHDNFSLSEGVKRYNEVYGAIVEEE
jgi:glycogen synthase